MHLFATQNGGLSKFPPKNVHLFYILSENISSEQQYHLIILFVDVIVHALQNNHSMAVKLKKTHETSTP